MGLLGKLFGDDDLDKKAKGFFDGLVKSVQNTAQSSGNNNAPVQTSYQQEAPAQSAPVGVSWGPVKPAEENQFNSGLSYQDYFEKVYREEFPEYSISREMKKTGTGCNFTFEKDGRVCLKVEVISRSTNPYKLMRDCREAGIGYTRFYHNNHGWWNTRSYVVARTRAAIK